MVDILSAIASLLFIYSFMEQRKIFKTKLKYVFDLLFFVALMLLMNSYLTGFII